MSTRPLVIAHRGGRYKGVRPNTLAAFERAIAVGADMVELDVRRTADGQLVIFHDAHVRFRAVAKLSFNELIRLAGFRPPLFEEALQQVGKRARFDVELKAANVAEEVVALLKKYGLLQSVIVTSFRDEVLATIKRLEPTIQTGLILRDPRLFFRPLPIKRLRRCQADMVGPAFWLASERLLRQATAAGYPCLIWTVVGRRRFRRLMADSRLAGVITDYPGWAHGRMKP